MVKLSTLKIEKERGERFLKRKSQRGGLPYHSIEPVEGEGLRGVMSAVVEGRHSIVVPGRVALLEVTATRLRERTDGLKGKILR